MAAPNLKEIEWAISELEGEESSEKRYELLAALYTCRNELLGVPPQQNHTATYSKTPLGDPIGRYGNSDFLLAIDGKDPGTAWAVMNELMETIRVVNPRVYGSVMRKLERV